MGKAFRKLPTESCWSRNFDPQLRREKKWGESVLIHPLVDFINHRPPHPQHKVLKSANVLKDWTIIHTLKHRKKRSRYCSPYFFEYRPTPYVLDTSSIGSQRDVHDQRWSLPKKPAGLRVPPSTRKGFEQFCKFPTENMVEKDRFCSDKKAQYCKSVIPRIEYRPVVRYVTTKSIATLSLKKYRTCSAIRKSVLQSRAHKRERTWTDGTGRVRSTHARTHAEKESWLNNGKKPPKISIVSTEIASTKLLLHCHNIILVLSMLIPKP